MSLVHEYLQSILYYNEITGIFTWRISNSNRVKIGDRAGVINNQGYILIGIKGELYRSHRLAWLYVYGTWPKNQIDHINGIRTDNRIKNLREVTHRENLQNQNKHRDGHLVGTRFNKKAKKWQAQIQIEGKKIHLGYYNTQLEAHKAYLQKASFL